MVTTVQEGGQFSFPPIMLLLVGFYFSFAVIRDPNSSLSFWVSIAPVFRADYDAGQNSGGNASAVANRAFDFSSTRRQSPD
jgi:hypothetical protein